MEKIVFHTRVIDYLNNLVTVLHSKNYFSFKQDAIDYKDFILNNITTENLLFFKLSKSVHKQYGQFYIKIKANQRTTWYVFFDRIENTYYIEYVFNNHLPDAQYLNQH